MDRAQHVAGAAGRRGAPAWGGPAWGGRAWGGFTLIELLVVVAIIGVIVSITLPALGSARETARRLNCLTNLKGIGQGLALYMNESKDVLPYVRPLQGDDNENDPSLLDVMQNYMDVRPPARTDPNDPNSPWQVSDVFKCPSDRSSDDEATNFGPIWMGTGTSYEYFPGQLMVGAELALVPDPARAVSKTLEQPRWAKLPILIDTEDWHPIRSGPIKRNQLYPIDYRADWSNPDALLFSDPDSAPDVLQDLICDIVNRFGGIPLPGC